MDTIKPAKPRSFTDWLRLRFKWLTEPIGALIMRLGVHPNVITVTGLIGNAFGAAALAYGNIPLGGLIILLMGPVDALDGAAARARGEKSPFGAFVDSVTDRYSEATIFLGLMIHYLRLDGDQSTALILAFLAFVGSVMVSYTKARGEALHFDVNVGWLTRVERYLILAPLLLFNQPLAALWIIAVLANVTALQRIVHVRAQYYSKRNDQ
ncbi:MAG: CDP-alcohol phosphatidyltransferase family protein [Chloroflexi bacterium]|nr:CDP-alcohol phosphatidyltransferase family protein [Chloroflexota bacterium]